MIRLLVSVRDVDEAQRAATAGADFIDLKEPGAGALGGLPLTQIVAIVRALKAHGHTQPVSATIGDCPMHERDVIVQRVQAVGAAGVDYVKVGIERQPSARAVLEALAQTGLPVVPVFIADAGLDDDLLTDALSLHFPALMLDTADKRGGALFDRLPLAVVHRFVERVQAAGALAGVAGALQRAQVDVIASLAPDFAGFRSAVCNGDRTAQLDAARVQALAAALRAAQARTALWPCSSIDRTRASSAL